MCCNDESGGEGKEGSNEYILGFAVSIKSAFSGRLKIAGDCHPTLAASVGTPVIAGDRPNRDEVREADG
jgi:hypothetical protein